MANSLTDLNHRIQAYILEKLAGWCSHKSFFARLKLARLLAFLAFRVFRLRRKLVTESLQEHLNLALPEAEKLAEKTYCHFLLNAFEMAGLKYLSKDQLQNKVRVEGIEHLNTGLAKKKGVIIVSGHFGLWELVPSWLTMNGYNMTVVVRRQSNPYVDKWFENMRQQHGAQTTDSGFGIREILKALRRGHLLGLMADQDNGKQGIFVPFFNSWASAPTGPAQISLKTGAPIVTLAMFPNFSGKHLIKIFPPLMPEDFADDVAGQQELTVRYTKTLETIIRSQPHNWFWLHRRWKTQPEDAPDNPSAKLISSTLTSAPKKG